MGHVKCPQCGGYVSRSVVACPACGYFLPGHRWLKVLSVYALVGFVVAVVLWLVILASRSGERTPPDDTRPAAPAREEP